MSKVMIVTGGSRGIGAAAVGLAAKAGWSVLVGYRSHAGEADELAERVCAAGGKAVTAACDVASADEVKAMFDLAASELGPVTALVNSAGVSMQFRVDSADFGAVQQMIDINILGTMICCREAARRMSTNHGGAGGAIVNISSMAATTGGREGSSFYAATKGAVDVFTKGMAREVAREGIRVNGVRPGMTVTHMVERVTGNPALRRSIEATIPMGRLGEASEIAEAAVWLASDAASFITGALLDAGGGGFMIGATAQQGRA